MGSRALLAYVGLRTGSLRYRLEEFVALVEAAGLQAAEVVIQNAARPDSRFYLGRGKAEEVAMRDFDVFVAYHGLKPLQVYNLERLFRRRVMDRVLVILSIFERRAGSLESKLQIELARLRYELPRVRELLRRAKAGEQMGYMGAGEYLLDAHYRHMARRIAHIRRRLEELRASRAMYMARRRERRIPEVAITGYTSAGKTTLFNALTGENKLVDGRPFATLETYTRAVELGGRRVVITDTIGFIDDLPPYLVESFHSTLHEIAEADLVLLVADVSDPPEELERKLKASMGILGELGVFTDRVLLALNKVDLVGLGALREVRDVVSRYFGWYVPISAATGFGLAQLKAAVGAMLARAPSL